jgi:hypothetical protein
MINTETVVAGSGASPCSIPPWVYQMMNPRQWTQRQSAAWHRNIPDVQAAFAALLEESNAQDHRADAQKESHEH